MNSILPANFWELLAKQFLEYRNEKRIAKGLSLNDGHCGAPLTVEEVLKAYKIYNSTIMIFCDNEEGINWGREIAFRNAFENYEVHMESLADDFSRYIHSFL